MAGVGVALRPHRRVELVQVDAVDADAGGPRDGRLVAQPRVDRQAVGRGVHDHRVGLVHHGVDAARGPEAHRGATDGLGAAHAHRGRHGADQLAVLVDLDLLVGVVGDGDVRGADGEGDLLVLRAVEVVTELGAVDAGVDGDLGARGVVLLRTPVRGLVVDPVPGAQGLGLGGDLHPVLGGGLVGDRLVEARDDHHADAVGGTVLQRGVVRAVEVDAGLVAGGHSGESRGLAGRHTAGSAGVDLQRVGAPVAERGGRLPGPGVGGEDAGDLLASVVDHRHARHGAGVGGDHHPGQRVNLGVGLGHDAEFGRLGGRRLRCALWRGGQRLAVLGAVRQGRNNDTTRHGQHSKCDRQVGTTNRRQLHSNVVRRGPI